MSTLKLPSAVCGSLVWISLALAVVMAGPAGADSTASTPVPSPTSTVTDAPPTTEDPRQRHLAVIIGVPIGIGLSILLIGSCVIWLFLSSYLKYRREEREQATNLTNLNSASKGATAGSHQTMRPSGEPSSEGGTLPDSPPPTDTNF